MTDERFPPIPKLLDYPSSIGIAIAIVFVTALLIISGRFDPTKGVLTISLLIIVTFIGLVIFSVFFTFPTDELTSTIVGGLIAAFAAVVAHWIGRNSNGKH